MEKCGLSSIDVGDDKWNFDEKFIKNTEIIMKDLKPVLHIKTGNIYTRCLETIINATNKDVNIRMVLYTNGKEFFVREEKEFNIKFKNIEVK
jgi:hypothetical protein